MNEILNPPRMLISDDNRDFRESLSDVFTAVGFDTVLAEDGHQAFLVACEQTLDLVLIDFNMPQMTGLQALKLIKQHKRNLPVILMSAEWTDDLAEEAMAADAFSVHQKPLSLTRIRSDVSRAVLRADCN